jgi:hypothetical protein
MNSLVMCIALATAGIDVGWERRPEGGVKYIIQLDPQTLELLRTGEAIQSDIPPAAGEVRSYRIVVGAKQLARETPPAQFPVPKLPEPKEPPPVAPFPLTPDPGGKPIAERPAACVESVGATNKPEPKTPAEVQSDQPTKPWLPLTFTLFGLFASLGANVYLGWIAWELRQRFRTGLPLVQTAEH